MMIYLPEDGAEKPDQHWINTESIKLQRRDSVNIWTRKCVVVASYVTIDPDMNVRTTSA